MRAFFGEDVFVFAAAFRFVPEDGGLAAPDDAEIDVAAGRAAPYRLQLLRTLVAESESARRSRR